MADYADTYCTVYVYGPQDCGELARVVGDLLGGVVDEWHTVSTHQVEVYARHSDEFSSHAAAEFPTGFYYFPFLLEVVFPDGTEVDAAVDIAARVLRGLWKRGWAAVAASNYADRLPCEGGVREDLPWPGRALTTEKQVRCSPRTSGS
jgi:hypothetical protein